MDNRNNPLTLSAWQEQDAAVDGRITLSRRQIAHLRGSGLIAGSLNWYYSPDGSFALAPIHPDSRRSERRKRVNPVPVTSLKAA